MDALAPPRDQILEAMDRIYRYRMTTTSGGNLSVRDGSDLWITPARVDKGSLRREDIVQVLSDGSTRGLHRPSSELPFHQAIYRIRPDVQAIVHAHPVALVAFSMCSVVPPTRLFHQAHQVCGDVRIAPYALPGSTMLGDSIAATAKSGVDCILLENHGVVVAGRDLLEAFQRFEALEFAAMTAIQARHLGEVRLLDDAQLEIARSRRVDLTPLPPRPAGTAERELRRTLCEFVRRGVRQRLLISTEGSFSARLDDDAFLITPSQRDRHSLSPTDIVAVRGETCEAGKMPSRAAPAHRAIYRRHPDVQAILFAHPVHATAFSVTDQPLDARTIPESYIVLREVEKLEYGIPYRDVAQLAERVSMSRPASLLANDGCLVLGSSPLDAFDRLEVLEATAEASIRTRAIGRLHAMPDHVIADLDRAFGFA
ncbi:MAG TPA: aldolase [Planctomycetaceae bacterium]|nr:aldolase [Planctomycetaceae bacterium]HRF00723.1 class II aldolase/adducin family protein [Pirellulaceae bacterium]